MGYYKNFKEFMDKERTFEEQLVALNIWILAVLIVLTIVVSNGLQ